MINKVVLMGRLVADPELKTTGSGTSVVSTRLAVERSYAKQGEERKADFIDIVAWRNTAEFIAKYFSKGSLIAVDGQLQSRSYQTKDGQNRTVLEVLVENAHFTGEKKENNNQNTNTQNDNQDKESLGGFLDYDDDLPFN